MEEPHARLFYVMGASGAGKDSIIAAARARLAGSPHVRFAVRYITRPASAGGEQHCPLSRAEFERRRARGDFLLHWESHGLCYGVDQGVAEWLAQGRHVVLNGSRGYLAEAHRRVPAPVLPVLVDVDPLVLAARLRARGRESEAEIAQRMARAQAFADAVPGNAAVIDNNGTLATAVNRFLALVAGGTGS